MLTYNFANLGSDAMYIFLYKCIKKDILNKTLRSGEKLPSKRSFAKNLNISVITVEGAYDLLIDEGFVYSVPKKGFFVADLKDMSENKALIDNSDHNSYQNTQLLNSKNVILSSGENGYLADFTSNQMDADVFPFSIWAKSMRDIITTHQSLLMMSPPCGGNLELRQAIARYLLDFRGMNVRSEQIIIGAGTEYLYSLIIQILGRDLTYGIENPGYHKDAKIYGSLGINYKYIDMDENGVIIDELKDKKIDIIHTSPSHHFPSGIVMPISRRYELLSWVVNDKNRYIIEDDYDSELRLCGKPIPTLHSIDVSDKVIYMNTFTKTLCSTVRISYMVLPPKLAERFYKELSFYSSTVSNFEQYTLAQFMKNGSFEKHINRLRKFYQLKRDMLIKAIAKHPISKLVTIKEEEAGVHFLMKFATEKSEEIVVSNALSKGIRLNPLSYYYIGNEIPNDIENTYIINYSSLQSSKIDEIINLLYSIIV